MILDKQNLRNQIINDKSKIKLLANYFLTYFEEDTNFDLEIKLKSKKIDFQIKDKNNIFIKIFKKHNTHEFSLAVGEKQLTFYLRLYHDYFLSKQQLTFLKINESKSKIKRGENSIGESFIRLYSEEDVIELISFVFNNVLNYNLSKTSYNEIELINKIENLNKYKSRTFEENNRIFKNKLELANQITREKRKEIIKKSNIIPSKTTVSQSIYIRNPYVVLEVLENANGVCGKCHTYAPFYRDKDNTPYLEVHHIIPLSEGGNDTVNNSIALCPNCHRHAHFGKKSY